MSITAQTGAFGVGPQTAKGSVGATYYWYKTTTVDFGPVTDERPFPPEVGGAITPTGAYRAGAYAAGGIDFLPRLEDDLGWVLDWVLGENDVVTVNNPVAGANKHTWTLDGSEDALNWATAHIILPGSTDIGMQALDAKAAGLRLTLPQSGVMTARLDLVSRLFNAVGDDIFATPSGGTWTPAYENFETVPVSGKGGFTVAGLNGGNEIPVTGLSIEFVNGMTTPQQEMVVGSYSPDDFTPVARTITVRGTYKWANADLLRTIMTGAAAGTDWVDDVFVGQAVIDVLAPKVITGTTDYEIKFTLPNVVWQITNPRLVASQMVQVDLVGTAIKKEGANFLVVDMWNGVSSAYTWPT